MNMPESSINKIPPDILPRTANGRVVGAHLMNFKINSAKLLKSHEDWISIYLVPVLKKHPGCWIDLIGFASRTGSDSSNITLSSQRIAEVKRFLQLQHPTLKFNILNPRGEESAKEFNEPDQVENKYWRAVDILWHGVPLNIPTPARPPEIHIPPIRIEVPTGWRVSSGAGVSGSIGPISGNYGKLYFTKLSTEERWEATYIGVGAGISPLPASGAFTTSAMPSTDGRIHSFQKISTVDQFLRGVSTMVEVSSSVSPGMAVGGYGVILLFGVAGSPLAWPYNLYTLLSGKQVLAVAGLAGVHVTSPDASLTGVNIKFIKWHKI